MSEVLWDNLEGSVPRGDKEPGPVELGLEAQTPGLSKSGPESTVSSAFVRAQLIEDDELGSLERMTVTNDQVRVG